MCDLPIVLQLILTNRSVVLFWKLFKIVKGAQIYLGSKDVLSQQYKSKMSGSHQHLQKKIYLWDQSE